MIDILILLCSIGGLIILGILSYIDLKTFLLPNVWVASFAFLGFIFHAVQGFQEISVHDAAYGALAGFWTLYLIRAGGNWYYKQDSLGLGDVKLLAAGGLWLGLEGVFFAITAGAFAGLIHGVIFALYTSYKNKTPINMTRLRIPAGPGFAAGIIAVAIWQYHHLIVGSFQNLF